MKTIVGGLAAAMMMGATIGAAAEDAATGDSAAGKKVFRQCAACHYYNKEKKKLGPHLVAVVGRKIGSVEKFRYSKSFKKIAESDMVWDEKLMDEYLQDPLVFNKKYGTGRGNMVLKLRNAEDRANVIAFLKAEAKVK